MIPSRATATTLRSKRSRAAKTTDTAANTVPGNTASNTSDTTTDTVDSTAADNAPGGDGAEKESSPPPPWVVRLRESFAEKRVQYLAARAMVTQSRKLVSAALTQVLPVRRTERMRVHQRLLASVRDLRERVVRMRAASAAQQRTRALRTSRLRRATAAVQYAARLSANAVEAVNAVNAVTAAKTQTATVSEQPSAAAHGQLPTASDPALHQVCALLVQGADQRGHGRRNARGMDRDGTYLIDMVCLSSNRTPQQSTCAGLKHSWFVLLVTDNAA